MRPFNLISRKIFTQILPIGIILSGVMSCTVSQTATRGYDGVYFDPDNDEEIYGTSDVVNDRQYRQYNEPVRIGGKYFERNNASSQQDVYGNANTENNSVDNAPNRNRNSFWSDDDRTDIYINNYYGSSFGSFYDPYEFGIWNRPYMRFSFGWSPFRPYYSPFHSGFYGYYSPYNNFYYPYYGGFNGYYDPFYSPYPGYYGGGIGYYPNGFYGNGYQKKYTRGKGDTNSVVIEGNGAYRGNANSGVRRGNSQNYSRNNPISRDNSTRIIRRTDKVPVRRGNSSSSVLESRPKQTRTIKRNDVIYNTPRRSTDKVYRSNSTIDRSTNTYNRGSSSSSNMNSSRGGGIRRR